MKRARRSSVKSRQSGQAVLEYAILLSFAATLAIGFSGAFGEILQTSIQTFNSVLEQELALGNFGKKGTIFGAN